MIPDEMPRLSRPAFPVAGSRQLMPPIIDQLYSFCGMKLKRATSYSVWERGISGKFRSSF